jgi:uncharacterized membrane protein YGL010W
MLCPPHPPAPIVEDWLERHRHPASFLLHIAGIPLTLVGVLLTPVFLALLSVPLFLFSLGMFVAGYALQFLGHALEGSEPGEIASLRQWIMGRLRGRGGAAREHRAA